MECDKPPPPAALERQEMDDIETSTPGHQSHNRIDAEHRSMGYDLSEESSRFDNSAEISSSTTTAATSSSTQDSSSSSSDEVNNAIDNIEASESDGKQAELLIVYTMKPESQVALGAMGLQGSASISSINTFWLLPLIGLYYLILENY